MAGSRGRRVEASRFAMVPRPDVQRSAFDLVHTHKTTFQSGLLIPVYVDEVLPGDSMRVRMTAFCRLSTPIFPVMDNLILESFFFFVPNRLVWDNWKRFMGEQTSPSDTTEFLVPQVVFNGAGSPPTRIVTGSLADYFGITMNEVVTGTLSVSSLPFRAYQLIYNEWFRDEDLQDAAVFVKTDGPDATTVNTLRFRGKRHDYFTSARPWPQKPINLSDSGTLGVFERGGRMLLPQSGAPVSGIGVATSTARTAGAFNLVETGGRTTSIPARFTGTNLQMESLPGIDSPNVRVLINDIRTAVSVQQLLERSARGGTRYAELVRAQFGVTSPDARLQRPEYLGGGRTYVNISPIAQQSATGVTGSATPLGELAGIGTVATSGHGFSGAFTEHGHIIGLVNVRADLTYQNGVNRMWFRRTQFDFYWPALANLGEQTILRKEIFANGVAAENDTVFGYQERWAEYRNKPNRISGQFRSFAPGGSLDAWHFAQQFAVAPTLGSTFIVDNPPVQRAVAVPGAISEFLCDALFEARLVRPLPMFSIPGVGSTLRF